MRHASVCRNTGAFSFRHPRSPGERRLNVFGSDADKFRDILDTESDRAIISDAIGFGSSQFDAWEFSRFFPAFYGTGTGMSDGNNF